MENNLRGMGGHYCSLTLDPSKGGLALQEASTQHSLQQLSYDPSFAERAAKYSTFGNARYSSQGYSSFDTGRLRDVLDNENMRAIPRSASFSGSQYSEDEAKPPARRGSPGVEASEAVTSKENSGAPQRKRKGSVEGIGKESIVSNGGEMTTSTGTESVEAPEQSSGLKRQRSDGKLKAESSGSENSGDSSPRSTLKGATSKAPQPDQLPKQDYIHVRARRGQATDSHSLAERVRREKISERMKFLQDLVPGCSKVTGKAVMLDEIINYVQSLQRQIEFLSMKLAAVNPRLDFNYDQFLGKEMLQSRSPETTLLGPDPLGYGDLHHGHGHLPMHLPNLAMDGLCDAYLRRSMSVPSMASLVSDDHFNDPLSQAVGLCNGDLQSVVEMGFIQGRQGLGLGLGMPLSHGSSMCLPGKLKVEL